MEFSTEEASVQFRLTIAIGKSSRIGGLCLDVWGNPLRRPPFESERFFLTVVSEQSIQFGCFFIGFYRKEVTVWEDVEQAQAKQNQLNLH